jgi:hypothetical protein
MRQTGGVNKSKGPFVALCVIVTIALGLTAREILTHQVTVTAADGSEVVIETDPDRIAARDEAAGMDGVREYGVSEKAPAELPESSGREANLSGTKVR